MALKVRAYEDQKRIPSGGSATSALVSPDIVNDARPQPFEKLAKEAKTYAAKIEQGTKRVELANAKANLFKLSTDFEGALKTRQDFQNFDKDFQETFTKGRQEIISNINDPEVKEAFQFDFDNQMQRTKLFVDSARRKQEVDFGRASLDNNLSLYESALANDDIEISREAFARGRADIDALQDAGYITREDKQARLEAWDKTAEQSQIDRTIKTFSDLVTSNPVAADQYLDNHKEILGKDYFKFKKVADKEIDDAAVNQMLNVTDGMSDEDAESYIKEHSKDEIERETLKLSREERKYQNDSAEIAMDEEKKQYENNTDVDLDKLYSADVINYDAIRSRVNEIPDEFGDLKRRENIKARAAIKEQKASIRREKKIKTQEQRAAATAQKVVYDKAAAQTESKILQKITYTPESVGKDEIEESIGQKVGQITVKQATKLRKTWLDKPNESEQYKKYVGQLEDLHFVGEDEKSIFTREIEGTGFLGFFADENTQAERNLLFAESRQKLEDFGRGSPDASWPEWEKFFVEMVQPEMWDQTTKEIVRRIQSPIPTKNDLPADITNEKIEFTMKRYGMTRKEVLKRLGAR